MGQLINMLDEIRAEIKKVIIGQTEPIDLALAVIISGGHALIEGVPGVAKTLLVRSLAQVFECESKRIQFTPDLMPSDIIGTNVYNLQTNQFNLVRGPLFTTFLLADEINRAPAKTQSALLQAMQERQVTIDRETHRLSPAFTTFATQNPIEFEGTYPLPEAQKDRFLIKITMECPEREEELQLARRLTVNDTPEQALESGRVKKVIALEALPAVRNSLFVIAMRDEIMTYVVDLIRATRSYKSIMVGAGPRATEALLLMARASAALDRRDFVTPDDVRRMLPRVLVHRLLLRPEFELEGVTVESVIAELIQQVPVPR
ncbi:MAG: MoxR family ATPase [Kiritimatiellae bacterium]|nr:MoxR family ATPase [Kiritimatiellia bacterium]